MLTQNMLYCNIEIIARSRKEKLLAEQIWLCVWSIGTKEISILYIYRRRKNKKKCKKHKKRMGHESARPRATLAGKVSTIAVSSLLHLPFCRQFPGKTFKSRFGWSARVHAILVASQCIGIHFKGVQSGWRPDRSEGGPAEGARSSSTVEAEKLRGTGWEKRIQGWNGGGCGIVERSRFTMMVASPVKANVALPPAATCIPWPFPYGYLQVGYT